MSGIGATAMLPTSVKLNVVASLQTAKSTVHISFRCHSGIGWMTAGRNPISSPINYSFERLPCTCDDRSTKRGFHTARTARLDSYRAANNILQMALDGKIALCLRPPGYSHKKDFWVSHKDVANILWIQAANTDALSPEAPHHFQDEFSSEEEHEEGTKQESEQSEEADESSEEEEEPHISVAAGNKFNVLASPE
ncbi:Guanine nucleotide-binding-like protein 1 [Homalodisca vitripennis]|nr:Guanine nucleotide-binding-like protein 1 [Homalodisca vitripennis]